jgi:hypothetical protein
MLALLLAVVAVVVGLRTGYRELDVDEVVYRQTLVAMHHGEGYYKAMRAALVRKEGAPPTEVRSVRPPTMFLVLYRLPTSSWRWVVGIVYLAILLLACRLAPPDEPWMRPAAVVLAGLWILGAAPLLFLHSELWGLPFLLGGAVAFRRRRWGAAAALLAAAVLFRETYAVAFLAGLVLAERRRPFLAATAVLAGLAGLHVVLAQEALSAHGREPAFGASGLSAHYVLSTLSPADRPLAWVVGLLADAAGVTALVRRQHRDLGARLVLTTAAILIPAAIFFGRQYWGITFGVALACFAPAAVTAALGSAPTAAEAPP